MRNHVEIEKTVKLSIDPFDYIDAEAAVSHFGIKKLITEASEVDVAGALIYDYGDYLEEVINQGCEEGLREWFDAILECHEAFVGEWIGDNGSTNWAGRIDLKHHVEAVRTELTKEETQELIDELIKMKQEEYGN